MERGNRALILELQSVVGKEQCLMDADVCASYEVDWSRRWQGRSAVVVRPGCTEEVSRVLKICSFYRAAVVAQGGNTGMVGGSIPRSGEVLVSLRRLDWIGDVDPLSRQVTVGAGATLDSVNAAIKEYGLRVAVDIASRGSATVGGMIATNAGGIHALRYGMMRKQVVGIEAVMANGDVVSHLGGLRKDNTGYDLAGLLAGSEGTLGVITAARLELVPVPLDRVVALIALDVPNDDSADMVRLSSAVVGDSEDEEALRCIRNRLFDRAPAVTEMAVEIMAAISASIGQLEAAEIMFDNGFEATRLYGRMIRPFVGRYPGYLLIECLGSDEVLLSLGEVLSSFEGVAETALATDGMALNRLWAFRELHTEAIASIGVAHKMDISVPLKSVGEFIKKLGGLVAGNSEDAELVVFGHLGDGNMHVNVVGPSWSDDSIDRGVIELAAELGGSISAEHGIGILKAGHLDLVRSQAEIDVMLSIKNALDPLGILNPGVLFPVTRA